MEARAGGFGRGKLRHGVTLALLNPEWNRPCNVCEMFIWKRHEPGRVERKANGEPVERLSPDIPLRCAECAKVPKWAKEQGLPWRELRKLAEEITEENAAAWQHYKECRAVGAFPDDEIVRWAAVICREVQDEADRVPVQRQTASIMMLTELLKLKVRGRA